MALYPALWRSSKNFSGVHIIRERAAALDACLTPHTLSAGAAQRLPHTDMQFLTGAAAQCLHKR